MKSACPSVLAAWAKCIERGISDWDAKWRSRYCLRMCLLTPFATGCRVRLSAKFAVVSFPQVDRTIEELVAKAMETLACDDATS